MLVILYEFQCYVEMETYASFYLIICANTCMHLIVYWNFRNNCLWLEKMSTPLVADFDPHAAMLL